MENNKKEFSLYIHTFRVHTPKLLNETFVNAVRPNDLSALKIPLNMLILYLRTLAARCAELNDPVLNKIMSDMTLYEQTDPSSEEYNEGMIKQVNKNYFNYLKSKKTTIE